MVMIQDPNNPVDPELDEAVQLYRAFMEEIKVRLGAIAQAVTHLKANRNVPNGFLDAEFGFLQLRLTCDLVALSVLMMHKPYGLSDQLMESWHARRALHDLSEINALSFPRPAKVSRADGVVSVNISDAGALKRGDLERIYDKCGRILHRGPIKHIIGQGKAYDIDALHRWAGQIGTLLSHHALLIPDAGVVLVTHLTSGPNGSVESALALGGGPFVYAPQQGE